MKYLSAAAGQFCALERCAAVVDRLSLSVSGAPDSSSAAYLQSQHTPSYNKPDPCAGKSLEDSGGQNHHVNLLISTCYSLTKTINTSCYMDLRFYHAQLQIGQCKISLQMIKTL